VAVTVKSPAFGPFEEEWVGVGKQADAIAFFAEPPDGVEVALRNLLEVAEPRVEALLMCERLPDEAAQFGNEFLGGDLSALQLPEKPLLVVRVEVVAGVGDPDFLETRNGLFMVDVEHHAAHVQRNMGDVIRHLCIVKISLQIYINCEYRKCTTS